MTNKKDDDLLSTPIVPQGGRQQQQGLSLEQALQIASQHQNAGQFQQAETLLRKILDAHPNCAPAYHILGIIAHQVGKTDVGADLIGKAISIDEGQAPFHANRGEMCRMLGRLDEAVTHGERAVLLGPSSAAAHSNLGIAYYDKEDFERAESCQRRALDIAPNFANALNNMGSIAREGDDNDSAIDWYQKAITADPNYIESMNNIGAVMVEEERAEEAIPHLQKAITINPQYAEAHCNLACCFRQLEQNEKALTHFATALSLRPVYPEARMGIASIRLEEEHPDEARNILTQALADSPENAEIHVMLGTANNELGYPELAEQAYNSALEIDDELTSALNGLGTLKLEHGSRDEAEAFIRRALEIDNEKLETIFNLSLVKKFSKGDPDLALLERHEKDMGDLSEKKGMQLHFSLGKAYDDTKDYDRAFPHFLAGCQIKRSQIDFDATATQANFDQTIEIFTEDFLENFKKSGPTSNLPVFILGMPRSGTTLTEQIIASHPDVYGAGELRDLSLISNAASDGVDLNFPANMSGATPKIIKSIGEAYLTGLQKRAPDARRITDKMPANFFFIGLIRTALPNAGIVHVNRNPMDTCVSNFTRLFGRNQFQSYDLKELGTYYKNYKRVMDHWRAILPEGAMYDLQYEDLVANTENEARRLMDYLELEWDDAVLDFSKTKRQVRTASLTQVRQPIYNTSVQRWKNYEQHLGPLIEALEIE